MLNAFPPALHSRVPEQSTPKGPGRRILCLAKAGVLFFVRRMKSRSSSGFSLVELTVAVALLGFLLVFSINVIRTSIQRSRDNDVLKNLQELWVAANHHFLDKMIDEVSLSDLAKADLPEGGIASLTRILDEDYLTVNEGVIKRDDSRLEIRYDGGRVVSYETNLASSTSPRAK